MTTAQRPIRYYFEMTSKAELRPYTRQHPEVEIRRHHGIDLELSRRLYGGVGEPWQWNDRIDWSDEQWREYLERPGGELWIAYQSETPAGYFELTPEPDGRVELAYFGLLPAFVGQGLGGHLLTAACERAFEIGARRVWVHSSTRNHPNALANYRARGFRVFREELL